ncbi:MAG: hypothetical protein S0880_35620, partial [Actinomycetota bacterium]|nr:hypothetical protein [Actinomycetota bacterium]
MSEELMAPGGADEVMRALSGLAEYTVMAASSGPDGLVIDVIASRREAPCPVCGVFWGRVKSYRASIATHAPAQGRSCRLRVVKRAFYCDTPGCERKTFTQSTDEVPATARVSSRCRAVMGRAGRDRSTASVASEFGVSWPTAWRAISAAAHAAIAQRPPNRAPRRLGLDETRFWWRRPWLTGLVDLDTGEVIDIVEGRSAAAVEAW